MTTTEKAFSSEESPDSAVPASALSLRGDLWTRLLIFLLGVLPALLCEVLARPVVLVIYLLAVQQRRAVVGNLLALHPEDGRGIALWRGYRVFLTFALTYQDRLWHMHHQRPVSWVTEGEAHLEHLRHEAGGALVFTIHAGNYDIGSTMFADKLGRDIHMVRLLEANERLQDIRQAELRSMHPRVHVHYNHSDARLGLLLVNLLREGNVVAVQGDRVLGEVAPCIREHEGLRVMLPKGPFFLAEMTQLPCYPIFLTREGRLTYRITLLPPLLPGGQRFSQQQLMQEWLRVLLPFLRQHWQQWLVFEPLLQELQP